MRHKTCLTRHETRQQSRGECIFGRCAPSASNPESSITSRICKYDVCLLPSALSLLDNPQAPPPRCGAHAGGPRLSAGVVLPRAYHCLALRMPHPFPDEGLVLQAWRVAPSGVSKQRDALELTDLDGLFAVPSLSPPGPPSVG